MTGRALFPMVQLYPLVQTGTAESYVEGGQKVNNTNAVAYAPSDKSQIAVAVVFLITLGPTNGVGPRRNAILSIFITNTIQ